jgi:hypothetical protein
MAYSIKHTKVTLSLTTQKLFLGLRNYLLCYPNPSNKKEKQSEKSRERERGREVGKKEGKFPLFFASLKSSFKVCLPLAIVSSLNRERYSILT